MFIEGDDRRKFLARVLPWPEEGGEPAYVNVHWTFTARDSAKPAWSGQAVKSVNDAARAVDFAIKGKGTRDIYVCMSSQREAEEKPTSRGKKVLRPKRSQNNVVALKALFLDIDFKGGAHGYATPAEAVDALQQFITTTSLPSPSAIVRTGGGLHVYWTVSQPLQRPDWEPLAYALAEATKQHGLRCDTQCTIDSARVLRVPDTLNRKTDPPRPVKLVGVADFDYDVETLAKALEPYRVALVRTNGHLPHRGPLEGQNDLSAGIEPPDARPIDPKTVMPECAFIRNAVTTGGKDYTNPLWNLTTLIATFMDDGRLMAHLMGRKHEGYTKDSTDELYNRKEREKAEKGLGWPHCTTISASGSAVCQVCPHYGKGKSPLHFGQRVVPKLPSQVFPIPPVTSDLPKGYVRDANGLIFKEITEEDGEKSLLPVHHAPMYRPWLQKDPEWTLHFTTKLDRETQITLALESVNAPHDMRKTLQAQGFMMNSWEHKSLGDFLVAWINKLKETKDAVVSTSPFGWQVDDGKVRGFVYNGTLWMPGGQSELAPNPDPKTAKRYRPTGDVKPWIDMAAMIKAQERPELDAIVASAFAGPLVFISGHKGLLLSTYSTDSGVGKSTAQSCAQAVWGNPRHRQMLSDTSKSVMNKIGELRHLPFYWDELKTEDQTRAFVSAVFQMDQGRENYRLTSQVKQREVGEWNTLMVCSTNDSLLDFVTSRTRMTTAGLYRIFEYEVPKRTKGRIDVSEAQRMTADLEYNYGQVGLVYSKFLGSNYTRIKQEMIEFQTAFNKENSIQEDERFWTTIIATVCMGAKYANELGYAQFDVDMLQGFMVTTLGNMRGVKDEAPVDMKNASSVSDIFSQFLSVHRARHTLKTNRVHVSAGKPAPGSVKVLNDVSRLDGIHIQVGQDDKIMRIRSAQLSDWLHDKGYSRHIFVRALKSQFNVKEVRGRLGSGTDVADWTSYLLEIDLAGTQLASFVDEV